MHIIWVLLAVVVNREGKLQETVASICSVIDAEKLKDIHNVAMGSRVNPRYNEVDSRGLQPMGHLLMIRVAREVQDAADTIHVSSRPKRRGRS